MLQSSSSLRVSPLVWIFPEPAAASFSLRRPGVPEKVNAKYFPAEDPERLDLSFLICLLSITQYQKNTMAKEVAIPADDACSSLQAAIPATLRRRRRESSSIRPLLGALCLLPIRCKGM